MNVLFPCQASQPEVASSVAEICVELFENQDKNSADNPRRSYCVISSQCSEFIGKLERIHVYRHKKFLK